MKGNGCIGLLPRLSGIGGMVSFQEKLVQGLEAAGHQVTYQPDDPECRALLVIGGSRDLTALWRARRRGIPVVQRLDGINWLHRRRRTGLRHFLRAEYGNALLSVIRSRIATHIVYQSQFSKRWWEGWRGPTLVPNQVIYNGVDLQVYSPAGAGAPPTDRYRLLLVEGSLGGGYEQGLETAVGLGERLMNQPGLPVEVQVVGMVSPALAEAWGQRTGLPLQFTGRLERRQIPEIDRSAHLLYSADLNAACPNSVIEALACGLPVVAFDTGALPELVAGQAGRIVPYGGDPWRLDPPDLDALAAAAVEVLHSQAEFRPAARQQAEHHFGLEKMVTGYLEVLLAQ